MTCFAPLHMLRRRVRRTRSALRPVAPRVRSSARRTRQLANGESRLWRRRRPAHHVGRVLLGEDDDIFLLFSSRARMLYLIYLFCFYLFIFILLLFCGYALLVVFTPFVHARPCFVCSNGPSCYQYLERSLSDELLIYTALLVRHGSAPPRGLSSSRPIDERLSFTDHISLTLSSKHLLLG